MYYVNREQIEARLAFVTYWSEAVNELVVLDHATPLSPLQSLAQERALHLAIEIVTDVGSLLIDGFIMRDASSYEDIIEILQGEGVFPPELSIVLIELVKLRKPLVQNYMSLSRGDRHPLLMDLATTLKQFSHFVRSYLDQHL